MTADPADCSFQFNPTGTLKFTNSCDVAKAQLQRTSVNYETVPGPAGSVAEIKVGDTVVTSFNAATNAAAIKAATEALDNRQGRDGPGRHRCGPGRARQGKGRQDRV